MPTIGRASSLSALLGSLAAQTRKVDEIIVADGSSDLETTKLINNPKWQEAGWVLKRIHVQPPNTVRQRIAAIEMASGDNLLMLDDDVVLEPDCVQRLCEELEANAGVVAATADFNNQTWPAPTRIWQFYFRHVLRIGGWQGRVIGPLLRFGYNPVPSGPTPIEWMGSGNSLVRRSAYLSAGGFSNFFLHRSTINEDIDLSLKLSRIGRILFCPAARMSHHHAPAGRVTTMLAAEDDLFNRFFILRRTVGMSTLRAFWQVMLYFTIETTSHFLGCVRRLDFRNFFPRLRGHLRALGRISSPISN